jgi:hypothetical protein
MTKLKSFLSWLAEQTTVGTEEVDERQIDAVYDKAKFAVKIVRLYDDLVKRDGPNLPVQNRKLLKNISTIATLQAGAYGLYNSGENRKVIGPDVANRLKMIFGQNVLNQSSLEKLPNVVIKKYIPDIDDKQIQPSDIIRVNVKRHLDTHGDSLATILEIASTIVHEATHELEMQVTGSTNEVGPTNAEREFMNWVKKSWNVITQRIPELKAYGQPA